MIKKAYKTGASLVIAIPREIVLHLKIQPGDYVQIPDDQISIVRKEDMEKGRVTPTAVITTETKTDG